MTPASAVPPASTAGAPMRSASTPAGIWNAAIVPVKAARMTPIAA